MVIGSYQAHGFDFILINPFHAFFRIADGIFGLLPKLHPGFCLEADFVAALNLIERDTFIDAGDKQLVRQLTVIKLSGFGNPITAAGQHDNRFGLGTLVPGISIYLPDKKPKASGPDSQERYKQQQQRFFHIIFSKVRLTV